MAASDKYTIYRGKIYPNDVLKEFASRDVVVSLRDGSKGHVDIVKRKIVIKNGKQHYKYYLEGTRVKYPFTPFRKTVDKDSAIAISQAISVKISTVSPKSHSTSGGSPQKQQYFKWRLPF